MFLHRQLPRDFKTAGLFERLRPRASTWELPNHVGRGEGHKGRATFYYTKVVKVPSYNSVGNWISRAY